MAGDGGVTGLGPDARNEEERKRDRQMLELLNELRIALPGVQILFAFLLTVPFTQRFPDLTGFQRNVFYLTLFAATLSAACLIAPSAAHRLRFHKSERAWLIESANLLMIAGLGCLAVAIGAAFLMITDVIYDGARVWVYSAVVWATIVALWFARPLIRHFRGLSSGP
jgi:cobalamin synthase